MGTAILRRYPEMISAGRRAPLTPNRHIAVADLNDLAALREVACERVICCVGTSRHVELMRKPLEEALAAHMLPSIRLLEQLRDRGLRSFVRLSTVLLYDEATGPVDEESPIAPHRNRYLLSQYLGEQAAHFYERYLPVATLRLCNLYGPWAGERTDLIHELIAQLRQDGRAAVQTREPERDFVFVDDAARAVAGLALAERSGLFNLGTGEAVSAGRVADLLSELSGCQITSLDEPLRGVRRIRVNSAKLRAATGWTPQYTIEAGVARTWGADYAAGN